jgi:hypothetical protein
MAAEVRRILRAAFDRTRGKSVGDRASRSPHPGNTCRSSEEPIIMSSRREFSKGPGADRAWLSRYQLVGVAVFLALFAGLVVWTSVAMSGPFPDVNVEVLVPALSSLNDANVWSVKYEEAP